jgi:hypothetical protein
MASSIKRAWVSFSLTDFAYQFPLKDCQRDKYAGNDRAENLRPFPGDDRLISTLFLSPTRDLIIKIFAMPRESEHFEPSLFSLRRILAGYPLTNR